MGDERWEREKGRRSGIGRDSREGEAGKRWGVSEMVCKGSPVFSSACESLVCQRVGAVLFSAFPALPPLSQAESAEIVSTLAPDFDIDALFNGDENAEPATVLCVWAHCKALVVLAKHWGVRIATLTAWYNPRIPRLPLNR